MSIAKPKKIQLENIPLLLEKAINLMNQEINYLMEKDKLSIEDRKDLISFTTAASAIYKDYRAEVLQIEKDLRLKSKEEILDIIKSEAKKK